MKSYSFLFPYFLLVVFSLFTSSLANSNFRLNKQEEASEDQPKHLSEYPETTVAILFASFTTVFIGGLGDKTFLIAAFMSMKFKPILILIGAAGALLIILGGSAAFGAMVPELIPPSLVHIVIIILFFFFGAKFLYEAYTYEDKKMIEEREAVDRQINLVESKLHKSSVYVYPEDEQQLHQPLNPVELPNINLLELKTPAVSEEVKLKPTFPKSEPKSPISPRSPGSPGLYVKNKAVVLEAFSMIFFAEWGDRSQLYTIALASQYNGFIVFLGAFMGHIVGLIIAIIGGRIFAQKLSERTILFIAGILYLLLGIFTIID